MHTTRQAGPLPYRKLVRQISEETLIHQTTTERVLKKCFSLIRDHLEEGTAVSVTAFGQFRLRDRSPRRVCNRRGRTWAPRSTLIEFRPSTNWQAEHSRESMEMPRPQDIPEGYTLSDSTLACIATRLGEEQTMALYGRHLDGQRRRRVRWLAGVMKKRLRKRRDDNNGHDKRSEA